MLRAWIKLLRHSYERHRDFLTLDFTAELPTTESSRLDVLRGEATSSYAAIDVDLIDTIARLNPRLKAIMLVRDPVDRAWSQFKCMHRADGPARRMDAIADQYRDERVELRARGLI